MGSFKSVVSSIADKVFNIEPPKPKAKPKAPAPAAATPPATAPPAATGEAATGTATGEAATGTATGAAPSTRKKKTVTRRTRPLGIGGEADVARKTLLGQ